MSKYKHVVLNTSRWETETLTEWLCYYRSIGFDHVYIYCNDDDPDEMYERLLPFIQGPHPFVTFHHLPYQGQQDYMYLHFLRTYKHECEWFMFVDADEFLALKTHNNIKDFMVSRESLYDCIYFNWIWFGPQEFLERPGGSTLKQFVLREDHEKGMNYFTKTLTRASCIDATLMSNPPPGMINHGWQEPYFSKLRKTNVIGDSMLAYFSNFPASAEQYLSSAEVRREIVDTAVTYHYIFRSRADFIRRYERGTLGAYYFQPFWKHMYESGGADEFVASVNAREDRFLADYWTDYLRDRARATTLVPPAPGPNLALQSDPSQSSVSPWSNGDAATDAKGAITGIHTGKDGFHTDWEEGPWWMTDLRESKQIREFRIFNSLKTPEYAARAYPLSIDASSDGVTWSKVYENPSSSPFGGVDGWPLVVRRDVDARFVRLSLRSSDYLHLDQVEIYGF